MKAKDKLKEPKKPITKKSTGYKMGNGKAAKKLKKEK